MQAGVVGLVDGSFDVVDSYADTVEEGGQELRRRLDVERVFSLPSGDAAFAGRAAREYRRERQSARIEDDGVRLVEEPRTAVDHTAVAGVPGEFVVVGSGAGAFAFDLVGRDTGTTVERATVDLDGFFDRRDGAAPWKAGFRSDGEDGVSGVLHGTDLREDHDLESLLADATLNQVGLSYRYDGRDLKMTAAESGYVELYQPRDLEVGAYLEYLREEILPHVG